MSMLAFSDNQWSAKDGMTTDPQAWCSNTWDSDAEEDVDWLLNKVDLPYDANIKTLNASFTRKLIGGSINDYTYKLDTEYEF